MKKIFTSVIFLFSIGAFAQEDLQGQIDQLKAELQQIKNTQVTEIHKKRSPYKSLMYSLTSNLALMELICKNILQ
jgi:hypothetical protein